MDVNKIGVAEMIARIDQLTTDSSGNLALFVTYWLDGQQIGAHRFSIGGPVSRLVPVRNGDGLLVRLDGVTVPAEPTAEESLLADQIGIQQEIVAVSPAYIAEFALQPVKAWRQKWERSQALIAQINAASDQQLTGMAAGRAVHCSQVVQVETANGNAKGAQRAAERLAKAQQAAASAAVARQLAIAEVAITPETPWPTGNADPRGYLQMAEVSALLNTEHDC